VPVEQQVVGLEPVPALKLALELVVLVGPVFVLEVASVPVERQVAGLEPDPVSMLVLEPVELQAVGLEPAPVWTLVLGAVVLAGPVLVQRVAPEAAAVPVEP